MATRIPFSIILFALLVMGLLMPAAGMAAAASGTAAGGYRIFIWPFKTDVLTDYGLYRDLHLGGFQIDRGKGQHERIRFSRENDFPFYAGHVADKGYLYLKGGDKNAVMQKPGLLTRPVCLANPDVIQEMKAHIRDNITDLKNGRVVAYALDDEISLGIFVNPVDVDIHPLTLERFQGWLENTYKTIGALNRQWDTRFSSFDRVQPKGFEEMRRTLPTRTFTNWNLSAWMDFRHFMDIHFAAVLSELTAFANQMDPAVSHGRHGGRFFSAGANFVIIFSGIFLILGIACMVEIGQFFIPERALILKNRRLHIHLRPPDDPFS